MSFVQHENDGCLVQNDLAPFPSNDLSLVLWVPFSFFLSTSARFEPPTHVTAFQRHHLLGTARNGRLLVLCMTAAQTIRDNLDSHTLFSIFNNIIVNPGCT